jgi:hypothetical protein
MYGSKYLSVLYRKRRMRVFSLLADRVESAAILSQARHPSGYGRYGRSDRPVGYSSTWMMDSATMGVRVAPELKTRRNLECPKRLTVPIYIYIYLTHSDQSFYTASFFRRIRKSRDRSNHDGMQAFNASLPSWYANRVH